MRALRRRCMPSATQWRRTSPRDHRPPNDEGPETDWQKLYFRAPQGQRRTHTHVRATGRPNQRYPLLFRDYLIAHPTTAAAYGELKRRLSVALINPDDDYPDVKDPAVDLIYLPAQRWAARDALVTWTLRRLVLAQSVADAGHQRLPRGLAFQLRVPRFEPELLAGVRRSSAVEYGR